MSPGSCSPTREAEASESAHFQIEEQQQRHAVFAVGLGLAHTVEVVHHFGAVIEAQDAVLRAGFPDQALDEKAIVLVIVGDENRRERGFGRFNRDRDGRRGGGDGRSLRDWTGNLNFSDDGNFVHDDEGMK
jgi:hypothetical protein